jgi:hypothetical protein
VAFHHLAVSLKQQQIARIELAKHVVEQTGVDLDLAAGLASAGIGLRDQAGDAGDLAELHLGELGEIDRARGVFEQALGVKEVRREDAVEFDGGGGEKFKAVVVGGDGERGRTALRDAERDDGSEPGVDKAAVERVDKDMMPVSGFTRFDE